MNKLTLLLLLIIYGSFGQKIIGSDRSQVRSDFYPAIATNTQLSDYTSKKLGMFLSFGMSTYTSTDTYVSQAGSDTSPTSTFTAPGTVNSAQWVTDAISAGADYVILTLDHFQGFNIFPYTPSYGPVTTKDPIRGNLTAPKYSTYDISATSSDQMIIDKFVTQCRASGIKFGFYFNMGKNLNLRYGVTSSFDASYDQTSTYSTTYLTYAAYVNSIVSYVVTNYGPDYMWLDSGHFFPMFGGNTINNRRLIQNVYNTIKYINPNIIVINNYLCANNLVVPTGTDATVPPGSWDGTNMIIFPTDAVSFEYSREPGDPAQYVRSTTHFNKAYYIPREIIDTIFANGQYFACNDTFTTFQTTVSLQARYNYAKSMSCPYLLSVAINKAGNIPSDQLTRFATIVK